MDRYFMVDGNIIYPDGQVLTWGPFYYHSMDKGREHMNDVLEDITKWCNLKDPSLNIKPENIIHTTGGKQIVFKIKAWKDDEHLEACNGIVALDEIFFED